MVEEKYSRILKVMVAFSFALMFVAINAGEYLGGAVIYLIMMFFCIFMYSQWGKFGKFSDLEGLSDNWVKNSFIGIVLGIATIIIGQVVSFVGAIGIPTLPQSVVGAIGRFIIIVPVASIFESVFFLDFLMDFLQSKLRLNKWVALVLMGVLASLFHLFAYGGSLRATGGSFFSAFLMFSLFGLLSEKQNDLAGAITWHMILNTFIGFIKLAVILIGGALLI